MLMHNLQYTLHNKNQLQEKFNQMRNQNAISTIYLDDRGAKRAFYDRFDHVPPYLITS